MGYIRSSKEICDLMQRYFKGLHESDTQVLEQIFHSDARYVNTTAGHYLNHSLVDYLAIVKQRKPTETDDDQSFDRIISIELDGAQMAFVKATMVMMGRKYQDFLTLINQNSVWLIISKVFTYQYIQEQKCPT